ncbi:capsular exopolysaccharide synthesis family protein [Microbacterium thalassium]|uniref:Capsular exopolysaccharide synthesis family protein n=2 Tax=Microbacterium thalassium TaxID=362649 RepID=A0A7X0KT97_9MICO|nr:capsular exopolysaccharide synthesis family protein [Microbacterium thalassium]
MTIVGLIAAAGWTAIQTPVYRTTASGLIELVETNSDDVAANAIMSDSMARGKVATYLEMATWEPTASAAVEIAGLNMSPTAANNRVTVANPNGTAVLRVTASGSTPEAAAALADAWIEALAQTIDDFEGDGTAGSAPLTVRIASPAVVPSTPVYPDPQTALIVGGVLGLGFGITFALIRTVSDRRIRSTADVETHTQIPVVGTIPISESLGGDSRLFDPKSSGRGKGTGFAVSEALRALRTNLQFMDVDNPPRVLVVTSPLPSDGKSTIAANLALTLAASGQSVVLVDGDLRRSTVAKTMGIPGGAGLSDVLAGRAKLTDVLQRTPRSPNLFILTSGSAPPNPSEVLGSERMHHVLDDLSQHAFVIVDAPPLLPVTDGAVLTHQADGALLVLTIGKTTYELLDRSLDALRKSSGRALGLVLNRAPVRGADASRYSYDYRKSYGEPVSGEAETKPQTDTADEVAKTRAEAGPAEAETGNPVGAGARRSRG